MPYVFLLTSLMLLQSSPDKPLLAANTSETVASPTDEGKLILFGASWCAPCIGEIRKLPELTQAAHPFKIEVNWTDSGISRLRVKQSSAVTIVDAEQAKANFNRYSKGNRGLPFSVMIDRNGQKCAEARTPLTTAQIASLKTTCKNARSRDS